MKVIRDLPEGFDHDVLLAAIVQIYCNGRVTLTQELLDTLRSCRMLVFYDGPTMSYTVEVKTFNEVIDGEVVDDTHVQERRSITDGR